MAPEEPMTMRIIEATHETLDMAGDEVGYYHARLDDPRLVYQSPLFEAGSGAIKLIVPVGGKRRGGYEGMVSDEAAHFLLEELRKRPDRFPNARFVPGGEDWPPSVEWGEEIDHENLSAAEVGRAFGYSEEAIADHLDWQREQRWGQSQDTNEGYSLVGRIESAEYQLGQSLGNEQLAGQSLGSLLGQFLSRLFSR